MTVAGYPRYESYKDSGVEWIGEVPNDWDVTPGRACVYENKDKNTGLIENQVLSLSYGRIIKKEAEDLTGLVPESFETYQLVKPGDIIIRGTDLQNDKTSLRTGLAKDVGIITSAYINLRPKKNSSAEYLHYLLHSYDVKKVFYALGSGLRQNLSYLDFKYLKIPLPTLQEQKFITAFLDEKCAKIDEAIRIKEEQIKLLHERRQILIQQAVTRGLNPDVPMKDSGIDWIGQIPAHWEIKLLKRLISVPLKYGANEEARECVEGHPRYIRITDFDFKGHLKNDTKRTLQPSIAFNYLLCKGDILLARSGATVGKAFIFNAREEACFAGYLIMVRPNKNVIKAKYLYAFLGTSSFEHWKQTVFSRATIQNISAEKYSTLHVPVPPLEEQGDITMYISKLNQQIENTVSIKQSQITALKEYKTTLINAAVTGKIRITPDMLSTSAN